MDYDFQKAFARIEEELLRSMLRNMENHKAWEEAEGFNWSMWQAEQLKALDRYKQRNQKKFGKTFQRINERIQEVIETARTKGGLDQETEILKALRKGYKAPRTSRRSAKTQAAFFRINDRKMDALIKATLHDVQKAETAILRMANDKYRKVIFDAQVYANSGAGTYEKAVDMAARDMLEAGLNCVEYVNGARHTLSDYADMAIRTASKRAYLTGEGEMRKKWGISTVIVNKRGNPCPKCLPFVGKVFIDDVWSGGRKSDGPYPLLSSAVSAGLYHPRCKDSHTTYFPGITETGNGFTRQELKLIKGENDKEQKINYAKRQAEKFDRISRYSLDFENKENACRKAETWDKRVVQTREEEYNEAIKDAFDYAKEKLGVEYDPVSTAGINLEVVHNLNQVIEDYQKEFGRDALALKGVRVINEEADWYAAYQTRAKEILLRDVKSDDAVEKMRAYAQRQFKLGMWSTGDQNAVFRHEIGHSFHDKLKLSEEQEKALTKLRNDVLRKCSPIKSMHYEDYLNAGISRRDYLIHVRIAGEYLSAYGLVDNDEFIAEALSEYFTKREDMRETARNIMNILGVK